MLTAEDAEDCPSCPICLQSFDPLDKAVISSCLHAFCIGCLQAWCRRSVQRLCPLCKGRIRGYLYNIRGDDDYQEHAFEDSHALEQQQLEWRHGGAHLPEDVRHQHGHPYSSRHEQHEQQQPRLRLQDDDQQPLSGRDSTIAHRSRVQLRSEGGYTWGDPLEWRRDVHRSGRSRSSSRWQSSATDNTLQQGSNRSRSAAARGQQPAEDAVAPRPYYWRVQQRMLASVTRLNSGSSSSLAGAAASALEARRNVYRHNLWAVPHHTATAAAAAAGPEGTCGTGSAASSLRSGSRTIGGGGCGGSSSTTVTGNGLRVSEASLEVWMIRELQALLMEDDVTIVCAFVKGLVNSFGVTVPHTAGKDHHQQQQQHQMLSSMRQAASQAAAGFSGTNIAAADVVGSGRGHGTISTAVAALEAFLFDAAAHFWHELCSYATSGLTVAAWDRAARYVPQAHMLSQQGQQQLQQQQQQTAAASQVPALSHHGQQQQFVAVGTIVGAALTPSNAVAAAAASAVAVDAAASQHISRSLDLQVCTQQTAVHASYVNAVGIAPGGSDTATAVAAAVVAPAAEAAAVQSITPATAAATSPSQISPARAHAEPAAAHASIASSRQKLHHSSNTKRSPSRNRRKHQRAGRAQADSSAARYVAVQDALRHVAKRSKSSSRQCSGHVRSRSSGKRVKHCSHKEQQQLRRSGSSSNYSGAYASGSVLQQQPGRSCCVMADGSGGGRWGDGTSDSDVDFDLGPNDHHQRQQQQHAVFLSDRWQMD